MSNLTQRHKRTLSLSSLQSLALRRQEEDAGDKESRKSIRQKHRNLEAAYAVLKDRKLHSAFGDIDCD